MSRRPKEKIVRFKTIPGGKAPAGPATPKPPAVQDVLAFDHATGQDKRAQLISKSDGEPMLLTFGWPA